MNAAFSHIGSAERVCWHADVTVTVSEDGRRHNISCDYCPMLMVVPADTANAVMAPFYYADEPDPLSALWQNPRPVVGRTGMG